MTFFYDVFLQATLLLPLCLGCYLSFYVLKIIDLTTDGSFVLGAGIFAKMMQNNFTILTSLLVASCAGVFTGIVVGFLQKNNQIDPTIAGILGLFTLQSLNLVIMEKPNLSLLLIKTLQPIPLILTALFTTTIIIILLNTKKGLLLVALGDNSFLLKRLNFDVNLIKCIGLGTSNGLAAISGVLSAQNFGYADINLGNGITIIGVGSMMIGILFKNIFGIKIKFNHHVNVFCIFLGIVLYFTILNILLKLEINPIYLKLLLGIVLSTFFFLKKGE